jgi:hypothetical protein
MRRRPLEERFWEKVLIGDGCWEWTASRNKRGYGRMGNGQRASVLAHRASWELAHGPISDGLHVLHRCDNPPCVRPGHLFLGTDADNGADKAAKGRAADKSGAKNGRAILTPAQVASLRSDIASGLTERAAAKRYGIGKSQAHNIASGAHWVRP